jgi:hypothetical protein
VVLFGIGCVIATVVTLTDNASAVAILDFLKNNLLGSEGFLP